MKEDEKDFRHSSRQSQNAVYVLAEFALDIMKVLETFNNDNFKSEGMLRIGKVNFYLNLSLHQCIDSMINRNFAWKSYGGCGWIE